MIANDLEFWRGESFDIAELFRTDQGRPLARRTRKLLNDNDLKLVLSRKTAWQFSTIQMLFAVATSVPELCQNTRKVRFRHFEFLEPAFDYLAAFTALTELTIEFPDECTTNEAYLDFETIVDCCPLLTTLVVRGFPDAFGNLNRAANLRKLVLAFSSTQPADLDSYLLPFNSAQTLESIGLRVSEISEISEDFTLDRFVNLVHFETESLSFPTCEILTLGKFVLTSLDVTYFTPTDDDTTELPIESLLRMFDAPSLQSLRRLKFITCYNRSVNDVDPPQVSVKQVRDEGNHLVSAIGANFGDLENLELRIDCFTSRLKSFAKLRHLKSITLRVGWSLIRFDDYDGTVL